MWKDKRNCYTYTQQTCLRIFHLFQENKQRTFLHHVKSLVKTMADMGNPFMDTSGDLMVLDPRVIADCTMVDSIQKINKLEQERYDSFFQDNLIARTTPLCDTITKAKLPLFGRHVHKEKSTHEKQLKVCQVWQRNMTDFFSHENQSYPPSFSYFGDIRCGTIDNIYVYLLSMVEQSKSLGMCSRSSTRS